MIKSGNRFYGKVLVVDQVAFSIEPCDGNGFPFCFAKRPFDCFSLKLKIVEK